MAEEDQDGTLSTAFANPWISIPYAIASGLAAGASPGTARFGQALNMGLGMGMGAEKYSGEQKRKQRLSEALNKLSSTTVPTSVTKTGMDPATTTFSMPTDVPPESPLAPAQPLPKYTATEQRPIMTPVMQEYLRAISPGDPGAAATFVGNALTKEQAAPHVFGSAESGYHALDRSGAVTPLVPGVPRAVREPTPPRPVSGVQGAQTFDWHFDPTEKRWIKTTGEATAAPARALTPEDKDLKKAQTAHALAQTRQATAQANRITEATKLAKDPKTTTEKLTTELSVALRGQKAANDNYDEAAMASWGLLVNELQTSLAKRAAERNGGNAAAAPAQGSDPKDPLGIRKKK